MYVNGSLYRFAAVYNGSHSRLRYCCSLQPPPAKKLIKFRQSLRTLGCAIYSCPGTVLTVTDNFAAPKGMMMCKWFITEQTVHSIQIFGLLAPVFIHPPQPFYWYR